MDQQIHAGVWMKDSLVGNSGRKLLLRLFNSSLALFVSASLASGKLYAAPADPPAVGTRSESLRQLFKGNYLQCIDSLSRLAFNKDGKIIDQAAYVLLQQVRPFIGGLHFDPGTATQGRAELRGVDLASDLDLPKVNAAERRDAIVEIVMRARKTRIVILNEAHYSPKDRGFAAEVARALRPLGFSILAVETLNNRSDTDLQKQSMSRLQTERFVKQGDGFYLLDPVFANFMRSALRLGYVPMAYEHTESSPVADFATQIREREHGQARNIAAGFSLAGQRSKMLVYVGHDHVAEVPLRRKNGSVIKWMAAELKDITGIDPLTIDQTTVDDESSEPANRRLAAAVASGAPNRPYILFDGNEPLIVGRYAGAVDLQVVHPPVTLIGQRPTWLARAFDHRPVDVPVDLIPPSGQVLIQAFLASEPANAVPVDQILVSDSSTAPTLMLPREPVRYTVQFLQVTIP